MTKFPQRAFVVLQSKDGGDVFREKHIQEIIRFDDEMTLALNQTDENGQAACSPLCSLNRPFHLLLQAKAKNESDDIRLSFPITRIQKLPLYLGLHLGLVEKGVDSNGQPSISAKSVILWYFSRADTPERIKTYREVTLRFFELSINNSYSEHINVTIFGDEIANHEMVRGALEATVLMSIGFIFLLVFVVIVVWTQTDNLRIIPFLVIATILTPFLATVSAFGFLAWLGYPIYSMQCVTPFLVLGIGVDDAFILMHRWRARRRIMNPSDRLRSVIVDVGPSISITSVTNIIAFGVGFATPTPQMSLFCLSTSVALLFDYIFTYTILAPAVFLSRSRNYEAVAQNQNENQKQENGNSAPLAISQGEQDIVEPDEDNSFISRFIVKYSCFLTSLGGRATCSLLLCLLYLFSIFGVLGMRSTFEPAKAFPSDSPLVSALIGIRPVFDTFYPVHIFVKHPPVLSNEKEYEEFYQMISRLEAIPGAYSRNLTQLFLIPYEEFDKRTTALMNSLFFLPSDNYKPTTHNLPDWLSSIGNPTHIRVLPSNSSSEPTLSSFSFSVLGKGMAEWANRAEFVHSIRHTLHQYPQFNASLFDADSAVLELILTVRTDLIGSIAVTVACMAIVCLLFVSSKCGVAIITYVIASVCFVLVGCLAWWGADLDPVTQVDVLLATGFSVDYTAHIAYKFYKCQGTAVEKIEASLREMALPMVQAGLSTFLCMLPLILVPTYTIVAFAKTVFLVVGIGLVHGLFVLPVLLGVTVSNSLDELPSLDKSSQRISRDTAEEIMVSKRDSED
ncbi:unnamed protein product [Auanema sp. JU1783]|nr:unnamed protein product [Auanema sp. JU1783]